VWCGGVDKAGGGCNLNLAENFHFFLQNIQKKCVITMSSVVLYKFGGTSVASPSAIRGVRDIIQLQRDDATDNGTLAIVVSAMGSTPTLPKTTDLLLRVVQQAVQGDMVSVQQTVEILRSKHVDCIHELIQDSNTCASLVEIIQDELQDILAVVRAIRILKSSDDRTKGVVAGYGELWSARILHAFLKQEGYNDAEMIDAREVLVAESSGNDEGVNWNLSTMNLQTRLGGPMETVQLPSMLIITGFICSTQDGVPSTLGRNGSDYSATIFGRLLNATSVDIWTDVSGVLSADPRRVPNAVVLPFLSYDEAMELAYFGANVLHPKGLLSLCFCFSMILCFFLLPNVLPTSLFFIMLFIHSYTIDI
jgi:aspartokinase/homoserine dehydrogenase 1